MPALGRRMVGVPKLLASPNHQCRAEGVCTTLVPLTRALKEGRSSPHSRFWQLDRAMPGLGRQAAPAALPAPQSPIPLGWHPRILLAIPWAALVPLLPSSSGFAFPKPYSFCHTVALPSLRANPAPGTQPGVGVQLRSWHHGLQQLCLPLPKKDVTDSRILAPKMQCSLC